MWFPLYGDFHNTLDAVVNLSVIHLQFPHDVRSTFLYNFISLPSFQSWGISSLFHISVNIHVSYIMFATVLVSVLSSCHFFKHIFLPDSVYVDVKLFMHLVHICNGSFPFKMSLQDIHSITFLVAKQLSFTFHNFHVRRGFVTHLFSDAIHLLPQKWK
jgi:hypothetical protein